MLLKKKLTYSSLPPQRLSAINQSRKYSARQLPSKIYGHQKASLGGYNSALHPTVYSSTIRPEGEARNSGAEAFLMIEKATEQWVHTPEHTEHWGLLHKQFLKQSH